MNKIMLLMLMLGSSACHWMHHTSPENSSAPLYWSDPEEVFVSDDGDVAVRLSDYSNSYLPALRRNKGDNKSVGIYLYAPANAFRNMLNKEYETRPKASGSGYYSMIRLSPEHVQAGRWRAITCEDAVKNGLWFSIADQANNDSPARQGFVGNSRPAAPKTVKYRVDGKVIDLHIMSMYSTWEKIDSVY